MSEERERKPRLLCDHSWDWGWDSLNNTTVPHAPPEAMQFCNALPRILYHVRHADPKFGPVKASKHAVKHGFYRMFLRARDLLLISCDSQSCFREVETVGEQTFWNVTDRVDPLDSLVGIDF